MRDHVLGAILGSFLFNLVMTILFRDYIKGIFVFAITVGCILLSWFVVSVISRTRK
jgi:hypothetical protein